MKIKVYLDCGICATITYLKGDGKLEFTDKKSGIIHTGESKLRFEVVEN